MHTADAGFHHCEAGIMERGYRFLVETVQLSSIPVEPTMRVVTIIAVLLGGLVFLGICQTRRGPVLIRDVKLFDGEHILEHRSVLIEADKIAAIGDGNLKARGAETIDGRGRTLLPGFFDAHVHVNPYRTEDSL